MWDRALFNYICINMKLLSDADRYTVSVVVVGEWLLARTLAIEADTALRDTLSLQGLNNSVSTASGQTIVDAIVTCTSVSVTSDSNLSGSVSIQVVNDILNLVSLRLTDVSLVDQEEDVTTQWLYNGSGSGNLMLEASQYSICPSG